MYKVFLVDDEIVIREGIRNNFPWEGSSFVLCGEAPDGEIALPMMQDLKPDILVTDIRMPFMDGLELSRQVSQKMPWVHTVILSGHDDFAYAREAISIGVKEYLLKPVSAQKLMEVLARIADKIADERTHKADLESLRRQASSSARLAREQWWMRLLEGEHTEDLLAQAEALGLSLGADSFLVMLLSEVPPAEKLPLKGILQNLASGMTGVHPTSMLGQPALVVLGENAGDIEERAYGLAQAVEHEAKQSGLSIPHIAIGAPVPSLSALPESLSSALAVQRSMQGQPRRIVSSMDVALPMPPELLEGDMTPFFEKLRYASQQEGEEMVRAYFASLGDAAAQTLLMIHYVLVDILMAANRIIRQGGGDPAGVLPQRLMQQGELLRLSEHLADAQAAGVEIVSSALSFRDNNVFSRYGEILRKACAYIEENKHRPEITLHDVARHVSLSGNHFCTIFSQEMGVTFTEYLTQSRIKKAKEYLATTTLRTSDIAYQVGYNDPHYFSYLFKKNTGMSPRDFRKEEKEKR